MWPPGDVALTVVRNIARCLFYCAARMVRTGTATDAVTIAAVTNAARALMISSLMKSSPCGLYDHVFGCFVTFGVVHLSNCAHSNTYA